MAPTMYPAGDRTPAQQTEFPGLLPTSAVWSLVRQSLRLSERELKIVQGIFDDQDQNTIAATAGVTPETVYRSIQRIYIKNRMGSRRELKARVCAIISTQLKYPAD